MPLSGSGTNLAALIEAAQAPGSQAEIAVVLSNKAMPLAYSVHAMQIPAAHFPPRKGPQTLTPSWFKCCGRTRLTVRWLDLCGLDASIFGCLSSESSTFIRLCPQLSWCEWAATGLDSGVRIAGATVHLWKQVWIQVLLLRKERFRCWRMMTLNLSKKNLGRRAPIVPDGDALGCRGRLSIKDGRACVKLHADEQRYLWSG